MIAAARDKKRRVINRKAAVRKGQQTGANAGNYLAKVGVEGSNPFARSKILFVRLKLQSPVETTKNIASRGGRAQRNAAFVLVDFTHMNTAQRLRLCEAGDMRTVRPGEGLSDEKTAGRYLL